MKPERRPLLLPFWFLLLILFASPYQAFSTPSGGDENTSRAFYEEEIKARVEQMECLIEPRFNSTVKGYLKGYLVHRPEKAENMLGKAVVYFPLFEQRLQQARMPEALKYLPVVESALNPTAVSRVGASGLWQFMESTGKSFGLKVSRSIDERYDPEKSTEAAIQYLRELHDRFGNWELALAAYNSGGGRVNRAIKRARSRNFWRVRRYLPAETRNYVPAFIAATYLMEYYHHHDLHPQYPSLDQQLYQTLEVHEYLSFYRIAQITGLSLQVIEAMNPAYKKGYIPANTAGQTLTLPRRVIPAMLDYLTMDNTQGRADAGLNAPVYRTTPLDHADHALYEQHYHQVQAGESLAELAQRFQCSTHNLKAWNNLRASELAAGQRIRYFSPKKYVRLQKTIGKAVESLPTLTFEAELPVKPLPRPPMGEILMKGKTVYYIPKVSNESLLDIASLFPGVSAMDILKINNLTSGTPLKPGNKLKIKKY